MTPGPAEARRGQAPSRSGTAQVPEIESYLAEVAARLPGPARAQRDIVAELRAGLLDGIDARRSAGLPQAKAAAAAVIEFGDPGQVADAFRPELAARSARRTALTLVMTGPLIGALWTAAAIASHIGIRHAPPWQWVNMPPDALLAFPIAAAAIAVTVWAALITVAATGRLTRWLPARPRLAPTTAAIAGFGAMTADVIVFVLLASQLAAAPRTLAPLPIAAAATASLVRLTLARRAARHCLTVRAPLM
jgi:hypothetical protein